jgi:DNA-binding transcriptional regulator YiaG
MAKKFKDLVAKMPPESQARSNAMAKEMISQMPLDELREAMRLTQEALADSLNIKQAAVSKMERRSDMYVSTLRKMVEAMGGRLQIIAVMPNGKVEINQFGKIRRREKKEKDVESVHA